MRLLVGIIIPLPLQNDEPVSEPVEEISLYPSEVEEVTEIPTQLRPLLLRSLWSMMVIDTVAEAEEVLEDDAYGQEVVVHNLQTATA